MSLLCLSLSVRPFSSLFRARKDFAVPPMASEASYFSDVAMRVDLKLQMHEAKDGFEVNAEYLGHRLFSKPEEPAKKEIERRDLAADRLALVTDEELDAIPMQTLEL